MNAISDTLAGEVIMPDSVARNRGRGFPSPRIARSALFGIVFASAIFLTILGALLSFSSEPERVRQALTLLQANVLLIIVLVIYLGQRVWRNLFSPSRGQSAPLLHRRFVLIFSLAALVPALIVGVFSGSVVTQNLSGIFGEDVRSNMEQAREILDGYVDQELANLGRDAGDLRAALESESYLLNNRITATAEMQIFSRVRELDGVYVLRPDGLILIKVEGPDALPFEVPTPEVLRELTPGGVGFQKRSENNALVALSRLRGEEELYLYLTHRLRSNNQVLASISGIEQASTDLTAFNQNQSRMNRIFGLAFFETAALILMASIWLGLVLANRIIDPLSGLIQAAERVRAGDMSARVNVQDEWGEISDLGSAFNRMTHQLDSQREELIREHDLSEQRRQFSEAVLSGVRAGVIGLTQAGKVTLLNESAGRLLDDRGLEMIGQPLARALPEFAPAFVKAREAIGGTAEDQVTIELDGAIRNFDLRVSAYQGARQDTGWVLTFDDMTRLVSAQRHSAWREVARRIAHEIKNPLTPIQLSAERLERKYRDEIKSDPETFHNCTQTIIRQVSSLEEMVNAFSAFARMPTPEFEPVNLETIVNDVLFEEGVSFPDIAFTLTGSIAEDVHLTGDARLLNQALTNIYKNAGEAVLRRRETLGKAEKAGQIDTVLLNKANQIEIRITDDGPGWPFRDVERVLEPYVTTRESGTGLGLAIVKRIAEDHGGRLMLAPREDGGSGAVVILSLPIKSESDTEMDLAS